MVNFNRYYNFGTGGRYLSAVQKVCRNVSWACRNEGLNH